MLQTGNGTGISLVRTGARSSTISDSRPRSWTRYMIAIRGRSYEDEGVDVLHIMIPDRLI